jgi:serine/threonine kinase PknH
VGPAPWNHGNQPPPRSGRNPWVIVAGVAALVVVLVLVAIGIGIGIGIGTCTPQSQPMPGALVSVKCGPNTDVNGPTVAAYGLYSDIKALQDSFKGFTGSVEIAPCQERHHPPRGGTPATPNTILGQIACGIYKGSEPQLMWSNQQSMVFALVAGKPQGPNLDQLYKWWAAHS